MLTPPALNPRLPKQPADALEAASRPASRTLEAVAAMAGRLRPDFRCAILLFEEDRLVPAAEHNLLPNDKQVLTGLGSPSLASLPDLGRIHAADIRPLMTQASEWIGALVVFGIDVARPDEQLAKQLEEVCWIATLAIEQKHLVEELDYRAHHDPLTHLWNRTWMEEEIDRALAQAALTGRFVGLSIAGIDSFRVINDVLGHHTGNELLRRIADRINNYIAGSFLLARGGSDEFMILMPQLASPSEASLAAQSLLCAFNDVIRIGTHDLIVKASIGTAVSAPNTRRATELQSQAYTALRYAKKRARGRLAMFDESMISVPVERLVMEQHLRFALNKREFELYYQPQVQIGTQVLAGVEALLRWKHPSLGFISPATFIPLAEEIGVIEEIGDWVIGEALRQMGFWRAAGLGDIRVGINVSALQFSKADFAGMLARRLKISGIPANHLELEITESIVMTDFEHAMRQLRNLHNLGISIALDDFGTGHSSLAYLQQLPVHRLKIDRAFVRGITNREQRPPLLSSIIQMAHALGLSVIAEGIETKEQALALAAMQCEEIQGFLFSKPVPPIELREWVVNRQSRDLRALAKVLPTTVEADVLA